MAQDIAKKLGPEIDLRVQATESEEARSLGIKSALAVFVNQDKVPVKTVMDPNLFQETVQGYLRQS